MPKYSFHLKNGKTLDLEGDTQPTDAEVEQIAKEQNVELMPADETPSSIPPSTSNSPTTKTPGMLSRAWHAISDPLTDIPSRVGQAASEYLTDPRNQIMSPTGQGGIHDIAANALATGRGVVGGMLEGAGNLASGLTSPINLTAAALTGGASLAGRAGYTGAANVANIAARAAMAPVVAHGAVETFSPDSTLAERGMGLTEIAGGLMGMRGHAPAESEVLPAQKLQGPKPEVPVGQTILVSKDKFTPEMLKRAKSEGYELVGNNDRGDFRLKKTGKIEESPILESEIGLTKPTPKGSIAESTLPKATEFGDEVTGRLSLKSPSTDFGRQPLDLDIKIPEGFGNTLAAEEASGLSRETLNGGTIAPRTASELEGQLRNNIRRDSVESMKAGRTLDEGLPDINAEIEAYNRQLMGNEEPSIELIDDDSPAMNASGESAASAEAMSRNAGMKSRGEQFVVYDRAGNERPLIGPDAVDYNPKKGETYGVKTPEGFRTLTDNGGRVNFKPSVEEIPTLYHGTRQPFETFDPETPRGSGFGNFNKWTNLTEDPEYSSLYSLGETEGGMKRNISPDTTGARTIAAKPNAKNVLDTTKPFSPEQLAIISKVEKIPEGASPEYISDVVRRNYEKLPFDAIKFSEHGKANWAVRPDVEMNTPAGVPLTKPRMSGEERVLVGGQQPESTANAGGGNVPPNIPPEMKSPSGGGKGKGPLGPNVDEKKATNLQELANLPRSLRTSMDMSAPLRQGLGLVHKPEFWKNIPQMFKAAMSEGGFQEIQNSIKEKPLFRERPGPNDTVRPSFAEEAGLKLTDLTNLSKREEVIMSNWAEKVPGVRASNRAYTAFLNKTRADVFENLMTQAVKMAKEAETTGSARPGFLKKSFTPEESQQLNPLKNLPLARAMADFVNTATGRGSLGKLESSATALNSFLFAPRLVASRLKMLNPATYIMADPMIRKEAVKSLLAVATFGTGIGQLAKLAGNSMKPGSVTVEPDPASADFGKVKIGNVRVDPFGGFQQYLVLAQRMLPNIVGGGRFKSTVTGGEYNLGAPKFGQSSRLDVAERFAESKVNPFGGLATAAMRGTDFTGKPFNLPEGVAELFIPMFIADLKELSTGSPDILPIHDEPAYGDFRPEKLPYAIPSFFGMSEQEYAGKKRR